MYRQKTHFLGIVALLDQRLQGVLDFGQKIKTEGNEVPRTMRLANKTGWGLDTDRAFLPEQSSKSPQSGGLYLSIVFFWGY